MIRNTSPYNRSGALEQHISNRQLQKPNTTTTRDCCRLGFDEERESTREGGRDGGRERGRERERERDG